MKTTKTSSLTNPAAVDIAVKQATTRYDTWSRRLTSLTAVAAKEIAELVATAPRRKWFAKRGAVNDVCENIALDGNVPTLNRSLVVSKLKCIDEVISALEQMGYKGRLIRAYINIYPVGGVPSLHVDASPLYPDDITIVVPMSPPSAGSGTLVERTPGSFSFAPYVLHSPVMFQAAARHRAIVGTVEQISLVLKFADDEVERQVPSAAATVKHGDTTLAKHQRATRALLPHNASEVTKSAALIHALTGTTAFKTVTQKNYPVNSSLSAQRMARKFAQLPVRERADVAPQTQMGMLIAANALAHNKTARETLATWGLRPISSLPQ